MINLITNYKPSNLINKVLYILLTIVMTMYLVSFTRYTGYGLFESIIKSIEALISELSFVFYRFFC